MPGLEPPEPPETGLLTGPVGLAGFSVVAAGGGDAGLDGSLTGTVGMGILGVSAGAVVVGAATVGGTSVSGMVGGGLAG